MTKDPGLKKYENSQDVVTHTLTVERTGEEVAGDFSLRFAFTVNQPVAHTWKFVKDLNLWMEDLHYNAVVGDAVEGSTVYFTISEKYHEHYKKNYSGLDPNNFKKFLIVRRAAPEKLILLEELSADKRKIGAYYVFALSERDGKTTVTGLMGYAPTWVPRASEDQMRTSYQSMASEIAERWKTSYMPRLRQIVESG